MFFFYLHHSDGGNNNRTFCWGRSRKKIYKRMKKGVWRRKVGVTERVRWIIYTLDWSRCFIRSMNIEFLRTAAIEPTDWISHCVRMSDRKRDKWYRIAAATHPQLSYFWLMSVHKWRNTVLHVHLSLSFFLSLSSLHIFVEAYYN
jgi:hypothetical protein